ncbi:MAG: 3-oxoacyl-ACP reductase family protein [Mucilaginibacter sp.]|uniref:SDR family NAD(P)-dependent oxidoreductase n=1 Tax=Mucilaginibacter sp. TaxID=1882438 RepID=UPI00326714B3
MSELNGKVALITGSLRGIGRGIALVLAEKGADIILNDIDEGNGVGELIDLLTATGRRAWFKKADVSNEAEVNGLFEFIKDEVGGLDILINNAGTSQAKDIFEINLADWERIMNTNVTSAFLCAKAAMDLMKETNGGVIVNISSVVAQQGALYGHVHYAASKSALLGITKTLARTGAPFGIRVNAIAPGIIETELLKKTHGDDGISKLAAEIPLGVGQPRDIGLAVAFLCGEGGNYITGTTLNVNGGLYFN